MRAQVRSREGAAPLRERAARAACRAGRLEAGRSGTGGAARTWNGSLWPSMHLRMAGVVRVAGVSRVAGVNRVARRALALSWC